MGSDTKEWRQNRQLYMDSVFQRFCHWREEVDYRSYCLHSKYPFVLKCGVAWSLFVKWTLWLDEYLDANPEEAALLGGEASLNDFGSDLEARLRKSKFCRNSTSSLRQSADSDTEMSMEMSRASISGQSTVGSS
jgi:hypothetical protein